MCLCWICAALPCFYVYTQSEESTPYESATTDSEPVSELEGNNLLNDIEDPYGIVEGVGELWEGEEYEPEHAVNADRTYLKFKKKLDLSPEQCFRYDILVPSQHLEPPVAGGVRSEFLQSLDMLLCSNMG